MSSKRFDIDKHQLERLNATGSGLALLREHNRFYQEKLEGIHLPLATREDFFALPFTTKAELVADQEAHPPYGTNLSYPLNRYTRIHATSGTTGRRFKVLDTNESWRWFVHCWEEIFRAIGVGAEDRVFAAFGFGPFIGFWAGFEAAQAVGALAIPGGAQNTVQRLDWILESEATVLLSTPTYALRLAEVARERGIDLAASALRLTLHAGEPGASLPPVRERLEAAFGARCWDHAGMSEVGAWGFDCPGGEGMHLLETEFVAEVLEVGGAEPVAEGATGELVLSNLGRWAVPALRYRTGDIVRWTRSPCSCGSPFVRFPGGILGRVDDMIQVRGVNVYPSAVEAIVREEKAVVEFEVEVFKEREMWNLNVKIELDQDAPSSEVRRTVMESLQNRLGIRAAVEVAPSGSLPRYELKARRFRFRKEASRIGTKAPKQHKMK